MYYVCCISEMPCVKLIFVNCLFCARVRVIKGNGKIANKIVKIFCQNTVFPECDLWCLLYCITEMPLPQLIWQQKRQADFRQSFVYIFYFFARALIRKRKRENYKDFLSKDSVTRLVIYDICYCITEMPLPQLIWQQKEEASSGFSPLLCPILLCRNKQLWRQWWTITLRQSQAASHYPIQANLDLRTLDLTFEIRETTFGF